MELVLNKKYGGFALSDKAMQEIRMHGLDVRGQWELARYDMRSEPALIDTVAALGNEADGPLAFLNIVEIPDNAHWEIVEHDGIEVVYWSMRPIHRA